MLGQLPSYQLPVKLVCRCVAFTICLILFYFLLERERKLVADRLFSEKKAFSSRLENRDAKILNYTSVVQGFAEDRCALWKNIERWKIRKPQIFLNPEKYLYPGLIWGPNNQIVGLWQSIYLAIRLNRTLVIPQFHSHFTNGFHLMPAFQLIDVNMLCSFVSCVTLEQMKMHCKKSFDVVLQGRLEKIKLIRMFERDTNMNILQVDNPLSNIKGATSLRFDPSVDVHVPNNIPSLPSNDVTMTYHQPWISSNASVLRQTFGTSAKCALFSSPFYTIALGTSKAYPLELSSLKDIGNVKDDELAAGVINAVQRPLCVRDAAEKYIQKIFNEKLFVGLHWRFDKRVDFGQKCSAKQLKAKHNAQAICNSVSDISPQDIALAIYKQLSMELLNNLKFYNVGIYIAAPPSMKHFKERIYSKLLDFNANIQKPETDLKKFLSKNFKPCWNKYQWTTPDEILSLTEMEIMRQSLYFFYSEHSTWSSNILPHRQSITDLRKKDFSVLKIAALETRRRKTS